MNENGFMPPQAIDFEDLVLGALLLEKEAFEITQEILKPETFYKPNHQIIYRAVTALALRNEPVDIATVVMELKKTGHLDLVGGAYYVSQLTNKVGSSVNVEFHARVLAQKYIQREMISITSNANARAYDEGIDVFDLLDECESQLNALKAGFQIGGKTKSTREVVENTLKSIRDAESNNGVLGPSTGLRDLDNLLRGLRRTNIYVVAGRVAMGKSAFILCIAKALCINQNIPIAIFSLEMSSEQLMLRLLSDLSDIDNNKLASGKLEQFERNKLHLAQQKIDENFHMDDTPSITIQYFESRVRKLVQKGVQYVIIDYLQLMELSDKDRKGRNREQEISYLTRHLKRIAKKYNIGIFELSQVGRSAEEREGCVPQLADLRESGAIEQDADVIIFLYRAEYYNIEFGSSGKSTKGKCEIIVAKHRGGPVDTAMVKFKGEYTRFEDIEEKKEESLESTDQLKVTF